MTRVSWLRAKNFASIMQKNTIPPYPISHRYVKETWLLSIAGFLRELVGTECTLLVKGVIARETCSRIAIWGCAVRITSHIAFASCNSDH